MQIIDDGLYHARRSVNNSFLSLSNKVLIVPARNKTCKISAEI